MNRKSKIITVKMDEQSEVKLQISSFYGEEDVGIFEKVLHFSQVVETIKNMAKISLQALQDVKPDKAIIEFGIGFESKSGTISAMVVDGSGCANIKITLEWDNSRK